MSPPSFTSKRSHTGPHVPTITDLMVLKAGLRGGDEDGCAFLAPSILPSPLPWLRELTHYLTQHTPDSPTESLIHCLAQHHIHLFNHYFLCKPLVREMHPYLTLNDGKQAMAEQLKILHAEHAELQHFIDKNFSFTPAFQHAVTHWVSATSPVIMMMGYPDAIAHAGQVSRLCIVKASEMSHDPIELLQASMVGWLHDPKFLPTFSLDNLCTHPIIAATIADDVFQESETQQIFKEVIVETTQNTRLSAWTVHYNTLAQGVIESLAINNDSRYVMERFVLPKLELQIQKTAFEKNISPQKTEKALNQLEYITKERLSSPSKNKTTPPLPDNVLEALQNTSLDTGLIGLHSDRWQALCKQILPDENPIKIYQNIIQGKYTDTDIIIKLNDLLETSSRQGESAFLYWSVPSKALFHHHEEVTPSGRVAALSLACSDPLLLSPHKVIATRPDKEPLIQRVASYIDSLSDNIKDLPATHHTSSQSWQRAILLWLLKSAETLTKGQLVQPFLNDHQNTLPQDDINTLEKILRQSTTWGIFSNLSTHHETNQKILEQAIETIKNDYNALCIAYRTAVMDPNVDETKIS